MTLLSVCPPPIINQEIVGKNSDTQTSPNGKLLKKHAPKQ